MRQSKKARVFFDSKIDSFLIALWIRDGTTLFLTSEVHVTVWCRMEFHLYPFDKQVPE